MPIVALTATIDAGQSLSNVVDYADNFVVGLILPTEWTTAHVSILVSTDNVSFFDLFELRARTTSPIECKFNVAPNTILSINPNWMVMGRYIKFRSGERDKPIPQEGTRVFTIITSNKVGIILQSAEDGP